jgi:uncharacterized damage-inducible protein DinB
MYSTIQDFLIDFQNESQATAKVFSYLTDDSLDKEAFDGGRTIGFLSWHIVYTLSEMTATASIDLGIVLNKTNEPKTTSEIQEMHQILIEKINSKLPEVWSDSELGDIVNMYGQQWTKSKVLDALIKHEIHHRGQLTIYMRIAGLKVPGIYGPSKEEWQLYGVEAAK